MKPLDKRLKIYNCTGYAQDKGKDTFFRCGEIAGYRKRTIAAFFTVVLVCFLCRNGGALT